MSDHGHNHGNDHELVESSSVKPKPILVFLGVLALATALVFVIIVGLQFGFKKMDELDQKPPSTALDTGAKLPVAPRLQGAPEPDPDKPGDPRAVRASQLPLDEMKTYSKQVEEKAAGYGWVDQQGGVAHIPIDRAKELIAEKGLPKLSDALTGEVQAAETARKQVLNSESSGGRGIKSRKPASGTQPAPAGNAQPAGGEQKPPA